MHNQNRKRYRAVRRCQYTVVARRREASGLLGASRKMRATCHLPQAARFWMTARRRARLFPDDCSMLARIGDAPFGQMLLRVIRWTRRRPNSVRSKLGGSLSASEASLARKLPYFSHRFQRFRHNPRLHLIRPVPLTIRAEIYPHCRGETHP